VRQGIQWLSLVAVGVSLPMVVLISNVVHEMGHALAATAVGYRVRGFIVGGTTADYARLGPFLQLGRKFGRAATLISPGSGWISGWRGIVTYAGGPAANLFIVLVTAPTSISWGLRHGILVQPAEHTYLPLMNLSFCVANVAFLVANLVPRVHPSGINSDGRYLVNLLHSRRLVEWVKVGESSIVIDQPRTRVWEFLDDPRNIALFDDSVEQVHQKPGTPAGVGRILIARPRSTSAGSGAEVVELETVACDPPRRVMARNTRNTAVRAETVLRAVGPDTTRLTRTVWLGVSPLAPEQRQRLLETFQQVGPRLLRENERIRRILVPEVTEALAIHGVRGRRRARTRGV
jgi:hypothetical protein